MINDLSQVICGYSYAENPFICGFLRKPINHPIPQPVVPDPASEEVKENEMAVEESKDPIIGSFSEGEKVVYWIGRTLRFVVNCCCAITDFALQILSCLTLTVEVGLMNTEKSIRECEDSELYYGMPLTLIISIPRLYVTGISSDYIAQDLGFQLHNEQLEFIDSKLDIFLPYYKFMCVDI